MSRFEGSGERPTCPEGYYNATIVDFVDITERVSQYADWAFEVKLNAEDVGFELKSSYFIDLIFTSIRVLLSSMHIPVLKQV